MVEFLVLLGCARLHHQKISFDAAVSDGNHAIVACAACNNAGKLIAGFTSEYVTVYEAEL